VVPNPYSPTAVARLAHGDDETTTVTVPTSAVQEAYRYLDAYLEPGDAGGEQIGPGNVVAVVGEYGTGKTHLAVEVLRHARTHDGKDTHIVYVDAQPSDFVELYKRFAGRLEQADVLGRVRELYQDVVIEHLRKNPLTQPVADRLSNEREMDVRSVVAGLGMDAAALEPPFQRRLAEITTNATLRTAFTLLLRPEFEDTVWDWFQGARPVEVLRERGIQTQLDTEAAALEAMSVIALLYGRRNHRLILVVDEIERVLSGASRPVNAALVPFKAMLAAFGDAGAFLLLAGLPEFLHVLTPDVSDRIGLVIEMPSLTTEQTRQLVYQTQRSAGLPGLAPFTEESMDYLRQVAEGSPRKTIRMCYHLYRRALKRRTPVTVELIQEVAHSLSTGLGVDDIRRRVGTILGAEGLAHTPRHQLGNAPLTRMDEWVHVGSGGFGVVVTDSVLAEADLSELRRRAQAVQAARPGARVLLVVNGSLGEATAAELGTAFNQQPLTYNSRSFDQDLTATIRAMVSRTRETAVPTGPSGLGAGTAEAGGAALEAVRDAVEQLARQQTNLYMFIEQMGNRQDGLRESTERRFEAVQGELSGISDWLSVLRPDAAGPAGPAGVPPPGRLPATVDRLFTAALDALGDLRQVDLAMRQVLTLSGGPDAAAYRRSITQFRAALRAPGAASAVSAITLLQRLVTTFRDSVGEWYRSYGTDSHGKLLQSDERQLQALCGAYDALYEFLPAYEIHRLSAFADAYSAAPELEHASRFRRGADLQELLDGLGARVQRTMLAEVPVA